MTYPQKALQRALVVLAFLSLTPVISFATSSPSFSAASEALLPPCVVPDNGFGTADVPVVCLEGYQGEMIITAGVPIGSTLEIDASIDGIFGHITIPGGFLGGEIVFCSGNLHMEVEGTGPLFGYNRTLNMPVTMEVHLAPRTPGDAIQDFDMEMMMMSGSLIGDPDFCTFNVAVGADIGIPSPGSTTLTRLGPPGSDFEVDSFFDITYSIQFEGCPGSIFEGGSGAEVHTSIFQAGEPSEGGCDPGFTASDNGDGSVDLPTLHPNAFQGPLVISSGLPDQSFIMCEVVWTDPTTRNIAPGGALGGETSIFSGASMQLNMTGTGLLDGFSRMIYMPVSGILYSGPRTPGDDVQDFDNDMFQLEGSIIGDPDFDVLIVRAGNQYGLPSPGHTTLTRIGPPGSDFIVDSFFDITYEIEFIGSPGSVLDGLLGVSMGDVVVQNPLGTDCDDGDPCTIDICDPITGECSHVQMNCDDEDPCTEDTCVDGVCVHTPYSLPPEELVPPLLPCLEYLGAVVIEDFVYDDALSTLPENFEAPAGGYALLTGHTLVVDFVTCYDYVITFYYGPLDCDDGDPCTVDYCDPVSGECVHAELLCDDGNPCTADFCDANGVCQHVPILCDDGDPCTYDYCDGLTGDCVYVVMDCDDGDPCTYDYCDLGVCFNVPKDCDDGLDCTIDYCDPLNGGCVHECIDCDTCPGDMNGDLLVNTTDLLMFLANFGNNCDP
jgi:hypothetical protein